MVIELEKRPISHLLALPALLSVGWLLLLLFLYHWTVRGEDAHTQELALLQLRTLYAQLVETRDWNAQHGGVYVPESQWSPANPWLPDKERSLTIGDLRLVKINPAYMTRQISDRTQASLTSFRISSLKPVRPANIPDAWEKEALRRLLPGTRPEEPQLYGISAYNTKSLNNGLKVSGFADSREAIFALINWQGKEHYRYMEALHAQSSCIGCHTENKVGEVLGGISVSMPSAPLHMAAMDRKNAHALAFGLIGFVGVAGIGGGTWQLNRRRVQAELAHRAKSAFLANMSHDMRTPLQGIVSMLDTFSKNCPEQEKLVAHVRSSAQSLLVTVNDIMEYVLLESDQRTSTAQPFALRAALASCMDTVRSACLAQNLSLDLEIDPLVPDLLEGEVYRLRQALGNLLGNAVKFTVTGGVKVYVSSQSEADGMSLLRIDVADTGRGIAPEHQQRIFERFEQGLDVQDKRQGAGLGLAIVRQIARHMGGDVTVESSPGKGSCFTLSLLMPVLQGNSHNSPRKNDNSDEEDLCIFDEAQARRMIGVAPDDKNNTLLPHLCEVFLEEALQRREGMTQAIEQEDWYSATSHAHAIKNSAGIVGCEALRHASAVLEQNLRRHDAQLKSWHHTLDQSVAALRTFLHNYKSGSHG